jgi:hypothetical protein
MLILTNYIYNHWFSYAQANTHPTLDWTVLNDLSHTWIFPKLTLPTPLKTRCVIHNGPAINLISTIDIYDKLVIARGKQILIYFNVYHVVVNGKNKFTNFFFIFLHYINYEEPRRDMTLKLLYSIMIVNTISPALQGMANKSTNRNTGFRLTVSTWIPARCKVK